MKRWRPQSGLSGWPLTSSVPRRSRLQTLRLDMSRTIIYKASRFTLIRPVRIGRWQWGLPSLLGNRPKFDSVLITPTDEPVSKGTL
jgi:hypothetical protein